MLREEELTERTNELRLSVATEQQRHENLIAQREPMSARDAELAELITVRKADIAMYERKLATQAEESRESETADQNSNSPSATRHKRTARKSPASAPYDLPRFPIGKANCAVCETR